MQILYQAIILAVLYGFLALMLVGLLCALYKQCIKKAPPTLPLYHPATLLGTFFFVGKIPFASGTMGSAAAISFLSFLIVGPQHGWYNPNSLLLIIIALTFFSFISGLWATNQYVAKGEDNDPGEIVMDEVAGQILAIIVASVGMFVLMSIDQQAFEPLLVFAPQMLLLIFLLFRFFDIKKMGWVKKFDEMHSGLGVMMDDIVAGFFAGLAFVVIALIFVYTGLAGMVLGTFFPNLPIVGG